MSNVGTTVIVATGPEAARAALLTRVRATASGKLAFTLSGLLAPLPAGDGALWWAEVTSDEHQVLLSLGLAYDNDALGLAAHLSVAFPALRFAGYFATEGDIPAFTAVAFRAGAPLFRVHFDGELTCAVPMPDGDGRRFWLVHLYPRSPERDLAAADHLDPAPLAWLAAQPPAAGEWRQANSRDALTGFLRPGAASEDSTVLVVDTGGAGRAVLLLGVDATGGYRRREDPRMPPTASPGRDRLGARATPRQEAAGTPSRPPPLSQPGLARTHAFRT